MKYIDITWHVKFMNLNRDIYKMNCCYKLYSKTIREYKDILI